MIEFKVFTVPVAQPRQRHRIVKGKSGMFVANYVPSTHPVNGYKIDLQTKLREVYHGEPLEGPLSLTLIAVMPRPQALCWKTRPTPRRRHDGRPDLDNILKATQDALNSWAWLDDSQVCRCVMEKWIASGSEQPHVVIKVEQLGTGDGITQSLFTKEFVHGSQEG